MSVATLEAPARPKATGDECHLYCCDPDVSLCGLDVSDEVEVDADHECISCCSACMDVVYLPCSPECPDGAA